jgi:hypothetical protein
MWLLQHTTKTQALSTHTDFVRRTGMAAFEFATLDDVISTAEEREGNEENGG